ncbi:hypothetical protein [Rhodoferax sp. WC2427]|uniref:hypothetical protein n=1 Tax=Rhodoferax sp. WC2427 TaxID=3234144 RepID=UPI00346551E4
MQAIQPVAILSTEDGFFTFSINHLEANSGPCSSGQAAFDVVLKAIRDWALSMTLDITALTGRAYSSPSVIGTRTIGTSAGAPVLRGLLDKYGEKTNRQLAEAIGLTDSHAVSASTFSNALAGKGSRFVRCVIALGLEEFPSKIWPHLSEKILRNDDEVYFSLLVREP